MEDQLLEQLDRPDSSSLNPYALRKRGLYCTVYYFGLSSNWLLLRFI